MMIPLLSPCQHSWDEAWIAVSVVVAAAAPAGEEAEVETFFLSIDVVGVFVETVLLSLRTRIHHYCLRL